MKNFVFDLYGTLVDIRTDEGSQKFRNKFLKYISRKCGSDNTFFEKLFSLFATYSGFEEPDFVKVFISAVEASGGKITECEAQEASLKFRKLSTHRLGLYRGVKSLLKKLKWRGAKLYLLSNAQAVFTVYELKKLGIYSYFDAVVLSSDFGEKKPSPLFFKHLVDKYNLDVSQTVFTGNDIYCDITPAKAAGMYAVYVKSSISPAQDDVAKAREIADFAVENSFAEVSRHLLSI